MRYRESSHSITPFMPQSRPPSLRVANMRGRTGDRIIAVIALVLLAGSVFLMHRWIDGDLADRTRVMQSYQDVDLTAQAQRAYQSGGPRESGAARWIGEIYAGNVNVEALLTSVFTGTEYLSTEQNDRAFAGDVYFVLTGYRAERPWLDEADAFFANGGSRITFMRSAPDIEPVDTPEGSVKSLTVLETFPRVGNTTIGLAVAEAQCRIDRVTARAVLYVDGQLRSNADISSADLAFRIEWDTRNEEPGTHDVMVLMRSSDGRGRIIEQGSFRIPRVTAAADNAVIPSKLVGQEQWFYLTPETRDVLFNTHNPGGDLALELFDLHSESLLSCDLQNAENETLRYRGEVDSAYYAKVSRGSENPDLSSIPYTVTVSDMSIRIPKTGEMLAVRTVDRETGQATAYGEDTVVRSLQLAEVDLIEYTSRLASLQMRLPDGEPVDLYPVFQEDVQEYGLYLPSGLSLSAQDPLSFKLEAQEGDAAGMSVVNTRENGLVDELSSTGSLVPGRSSNTLSIQVTGYDGSRRTYKIYILYGPHAEGYDQDTLLRFPDGYQSGLWLLHQVRPTYVLEPFDTGIAWGDFIDKQDEEARSLIQSDSVPTGWVEPGSPVYDGTAWKAAARPVIEYYADTRNFLLPRTLFQFERLTFDETVQNRAGIKSILEGTFMSIDADGYADMFYTAGERAGISPYFLASRAIQEMGSGGQSPLAYGTLTDYEGYFNFFNIGSYPNPSVVDGQRINGALFAMYGNEPEEMELSPEEEVLLLPWDTAEKSIIGGAKFIADRYVAAGQDTLYFQKFDVIPENGLYTRQYAQNIQMAWAEGLRYFNAYRSIGLLDASFVFRIPFYRDMPASITQLP